MADSSQQEELPRTTSGQVCRAVRLHLIWLTLEAGGRHSNQEFMDRFNISYDSVERDMKALERDCHLPLRRIDVHEVWWQVIDEKDELPKNSA